MSSTLCEAAARVTYTGQRHWHNTRKPKTNQLKDLCALLPVREHTDHLCSLQRYAQAGGAVSPTTQPLQLPHTTLQHRRKPSKDAYQHGSRSRNREQSY